MKSECLVQGPVVDEDREKGEDIKRMKLMNLSDENYAKPV